MTDDGNAEYRIELSATFIMDIYSSVLGPPGLDRTGIEGLIERDWASISADKNILQQSQWELISFEEVPETVTGITAQPASSSEGSIMLVEVDDERAWVLLVTEGASVLWPPEIYMSPGRAVLEAERWASLMAQSEADVRDRSTDAGRSAIVTFDSSSSIGPTWMSRGSAPTGTEAVCQIRKPSCSKTAMTRCPGSGRHAHPAWNPPLLTSFPGSSPQVTRCGARWRRQSPNLRRWCPDG